MSLVRKGLITSAGRGTAVGIQFVNGILLARWLHVAGTGQSQLAVVFNQLVGAFGSLGIGIASIYFINNRRLPIRTVTMHLLWIGFTWFPVYGLILWGLYLRFPGFFGHLPATVTLIVCVGATLNRIALLFTPILLVEYRATDAAILDTAQSAAQLICTAGLAAAGWLTVNTSLMALTFSSGSGVVLGLWMVRRHVDLRVRPTRALTGELIGMGFKLAMVNVALLAHMAAPMLLLRALSRDFDAVGLYRQAYSLCGLVALVGTAAGPLLYSRWAGEEGIEARARQVELATRLYALIGFALATLMAVFAYYILRLPYGREFAPAAAVLRILAFGTALQLLADTLLNLFTAIGRPMLGAGLFGVTLAVNVGLNLLLIPRFGPMGSAVAMVIASLVYLGGGTWLACRLCDVRLANCFIPRRADLRRLIEAVRPSRRL